MRAFLLVSLGLAGCTAEAGTSATARLGEDIILVHTGAQSVAFTGFVLAAGARPRPLYFGMLAPGGQPLASDAPPPDGKTLRLRFQPAAEDRVTEVGELRMVGPSLMTFLGSGTDEFEEIRPEEGVAEHLYQGGPLRLTIEVVDGKVVLTEG